MKNTRTSQLRRGVRRHLELHVHACAVQPEQQESRYRKRFIPESLVTRHAGQGERRLWERDWVRPSVVKKPRMRLQNINRAIPLDAVPEHRIKRRSPRFRSGYRFCELNFRYLSPGIEGEKFRPLDHM